MQSSAGISPGSSCEFYLTSPSAGVFARSQQGEMPEYDLLEQFPC
ncbi:hypothetical protein [Fischerella thermalis]